MRVTTSQLIKIQFFRAADLAVTGSDPSTVTLVIPQVSDIDEDDEYGMKKVVDYYKEFEVYMHDYTVNDSYTLHMN